jgi:hypothetical protein
MVLQRAWGRAVRDRSKKIKVAREDLEATLEQFREIVSDLGNRATGVLQVRPSQPVQEYARKKLSYVMSTFRSLNGHWGQRQRKKKEGAG